MKLKKKKRSHAPQLAKLLLVSLALFSAASSVNASADDPILVETNIVSTMEGPGFAPENYTFKQGHEYLWVMTNENSQSLSFNYDTFGQKIFTHYLQGTPSVTQNSFALPSQSKVYWLFVPSAPGEYQFYISNPSTNQKGKGGKIIVNAEPTAASEKPTNADEVNENEEKQSTDIAQSKDKTKEGSKEEAKSGSKETSKKKFLPDFFTRR